jgi:c-di-GMP-binding flagellar brake protein YcgR
MEEPFLYPTINQVTELLIKIDGETKSYTTRIADIGDDYVKIEIPFKAGTSNLISLPTGTKIVVSYSFSKGQFSFETQVLHTQDDNIPLFVLKKPDIGNIERLQRRNYLRVPVEAEISVQTVTDKFTSYTEDVSGGGVSLYCNEDLKLNSNEPCQCILILHFRNGSVSQVSFTGKVVRIKKTSGKMLQWISIKIDRIADSDQQKIIRFCFEKQIDMKK